MKSQAGYEMFISVSIFIVAIAYVFYEILSFYPSYINELEKEILYSEAYKISQILINDAGEPVNWFNDLLSAKRIGLSNENYNTLNLLSTTKILALNSYCNTNYQLVKRLIGTNYNFNIVLRLSNGTIPLNCTYSFGENVAKISRVVSLDDLKSYGELIVWVY